MKVAKKDLLNQDFEGLMKYFRVNIPKTYRSEENAKQLLVVAKSIKLKKMSKYQKEWLAIKEAEAKQRRLSEKRDLTARSAPLQKAGDGKPHLSERSVPVKRPLQQQQSHQPQQQKRTRQYPVAEEFLPFAVYVEKFDEKKVLVKMTGNEFDTIKVGVVNTYWLESLAFQNKLKDDIDRRLFSSERGVATFFAKSEFAQTFIIKTINELVKLPGVKARGPRVESRPNLHVDFPAALERISPEIAIKELILMHANIECEPVVHHIKPWAHGRTVSVELPADKLAQLATWGLDNNADSFSMFSEKLHFWTAFKPNRDPLKDSLEAKEVIEVMTEASTVSAGTAATQEEQTTPAILEVKDEAPPKSAFPRPSSPNMELDNPMPTSSTPVDLEIQNSNFGTLAR